MNIIAVNEMMLSLMVWINAVTGFTIPEIPHIRTATFSEMKHITYDCDYIREINKTVCNTDNIGELTLALYLPNEKTILLYEDWNKYKKVDQSILLHELIHHMQHENNYDKDMKFCGMPALEAQAYEMQNEWLKKYEMTLQKDLSISPSFLFVITQCEN